MVAVFGCSKLTDSMSTIFGFFAVSACFVIILDCFIGFNNLEAVFGSPTVTDFLSQLLGCSTVFDNLLIFSSFF